MVTRMAIEKQLHEKISIRVQRVLTGIKNQLKILRVAETIIESVNENIRKGSDEWHRLEFEILCFAVFVATNQTRKHIVSKGSFDEEVVEKLCGLFDGGLAYHCMSSCRDEFQNDVVEQLTNYQKAENNETGGSLRLFGIFIARAVTGNMQKRLNSYMSATSAGERFGLLIGEIAMNAMKAELGHRAIHA